jgi:hypothetical protein
MKLVFNLKIIRFKVNYTKFNNQRKFLRLISRQLINIYKKIKEIEKRLINRDKKTF